MGLDVPWGKVIQGLFCCFVLHHARANRHPLTPPPAVINSSIKGFTVDRDVARKLNKEIVPLIKRSEGIFLSSPGVAEASGGRFWLQEDPLWPPSKRTFTRITNICIVPLLLSGI